MSAQALYRERHPDRVAQHQRNWREAHPDYHRDWADRNRERRNAQARARNATPEAKAKRAAVYADWAKRNRQRRAFTQAQRVARQRSAPVCDLTAQQWDSILAVYSARCFYCGQPGSEQEHRVPLIRGGSHTASNVVPACRSCNARKGTLTDAEFLERQQ